MNLKMLCKFRYFIFAALIVLCSCTTTGVYIEPPHNLPPPRVFENVKIALVLGGGGAKGLVHLGVLEVFEENGIPIDLIVGTSVGSMIGAMYADYQDTSSMKEILLNLKKDDFLDISISDTLSFFTDIKAPVQGYYLEEFVVNNLTATNMEELKIPFIAVATDVNSDKSIAIDSGPIATAVHASSAIPPVFTPVRAYGKMLVDGGVIEPVPVLTARKYDPLLVIAVDISTPGRGYEMYNMLDVTYRSMYISYYTMSRMQSALADITIHPDLAGYSVFNDKYNHELYMMGREEAIKMLPQILKEMKRRKIPIKKNKTKL